MLNSENSVSIQDEWITKETALEVAFQLLTRAKVSKTASGLLLEQTGETLELNIEQPISMKDVSIEIEELSAPKNLQDSPNPELKRIVIKQRTPARSSGKLYIKVKAL